MFALKHLSQGNGHSRCCKHFPHAHFVAGQPVGCGPRTGIRQTASFQRCNGLYARQSVPVRSVAVAEIQNHICLQPGHDRVNIGKSHPEGLRLVAESFKGCQHATQGILSADFRLFLVASASTRLGRIAQENSYSPGEDAHAPMFHNPEAIARQ